MGKYLRYYEEENNRHQDMHQLYVDPTHCRAVVAELCIHFKIPLIRILVSQGKKSSNYMSSHVRNGVLIKNRIRIDLSMMNLLTIAHEFAHYVHDLDYKQRKLRYQAQRNLRKNQGLSDLGPYGRERWHGHQHRQFTDKIISVIKALEWPLTVATKKDNVVKKESNNGQ